VDALEGQVEAAQYLQVVELELVVKRLQMLLFLYERVVVDLVREVAEVEDDL